MKRFLCAVMRIFKCCRSMHQIHTFQIGKEIAARFFALFILDSCMFDF